ncbi:MAG: hypothetical protein LH614_21190 [Pyrinomonadaceae bacterium]|nr:hypothetical protein [Pyrinomonadaceae bacterium]
MENKQELSENALKHWQMMDGEYGVANQIVNSKLSDEEQQNRCEAFLELEKNKILREVARDDDGTIEYEVLIPYRRNKD